MYVGIYLPRYSAHAVHHYRAAAISVWFPVRLYE